MAISPTLQRQCFSCTTWDSLSPFTTVCSFTLSMVMSETKIMSVPWKCPIYRVLNHIDVHRTGFDVCGIWAWCFQEQRVLVVILNKYTGSAAMLFVLYERYISISRNILLNTPSVSLGNVYRDVVINIVQASTVAPCEVLNFPRSVKATRAARLAQGLFNQYADVTNLVLCSNSVSISL